MSLTPFLSLVALGLTLTGCSSLSRKPLVPVPPATLTGGWTRAGLETPPLEQAPGTLRALKPGQWVRTSYQGSYTKGAILVDGFGMPTEASAFEASQKWRNEPGTVSFRKGNVFVVLSSPTESTQSLVDFSKRLEREWLSAER